MQDIRQAISDDEAHVVAKFVKSACVRHTRAHWSNFRGKRRDYRRYVVLGEGSPAELLGGAVQALARGGHGAACHICAFAGGDKANGAEGVSDLPALKDTAAFLFLDCRTAGDDDARLGATRDLLLKISQSRTNFATVCVYLPEIEAIPHGVTHLAEREYSYFIETKPKKTAGESFLLKIEALCREAVRDMGANVVLLRAPHMFGAGVADETGISLRKTVEDILSAGRIEIGPADYGAVRSYASAMDIAEKAWGASLQAASGNVFNIPSFDASIADVKWAVWGYSAHGLPVSAKVENWPPRSFHCLADLKFSMLHFGKKCNCPRGLRNLFCQIAGTKSPPSKNSAFYCGKEKTIKSLEMDILREIDRICVKYDIKYFLAAGSLLGAHRYGHNIPWDDDLDVGFLRSEFRKFRKVVEKELPPHMVYCAWYNDANAHYTVDKIRIRDTWYSTKYSSNKFMPDGVFVDFLVYDPTSDIPAIAWLHNKIAGIYQWFGLQVLWYGLQRRDFRHTSLFLLYKALSLIPIRAWHWMYERWLMLFSFKRRPKFLLDSLGARAGIKLIPAQGLLDGTVRIPFDDGFMAPSPAEPEGYLRFAYGDNWREEPPLSEQVLHHNPGRVDLGSLVFGGKYDGSFRPLDIRGELYEEEI